MPGVCFVKRPVEAAEEGSHGQVHAPVSIIDRRVDEHGVTSLVAKKVAAPQIDCMTEQGSNSVGTERRSRAQPWRGLFFKDGVQGLIQSLELLHFPGAQEAFVHRQL